MSIYVYIYTGDGTNSSLYCALILNVQAMYKSHGMLITDTLFLLLLLKIPDLPSKFIAKVELKELSLLLKYCLVLCETQQSVLA